MSLDDNALHLPPPDRYCKTFRYGFMLQMPNKSLALNLDDLVTGNYVILNLNPQDISVREPLATAVTRMQAGGKVIESDGMLTKSISVSGTTGYLPASHNQPGIIGVGRAALSTGLADPWAGESAAESSRQRRSGFKAFYDLRYLFRKFGKLRKEKVPVRMHWLDFKGDEFWEIEPHEFSLKRSAGRNRFTYDYSINFETIQPSDGENSLVTEQFGVTALGAIYTGKKTSAPTALSGFGVRAVNNTPEVLTAVRRFRNRTQGQSALQFMRLMSGSVQRNFQGMLRDMNQVVGYFESVHNAVKSVVIDTPLALLSQLDNSITGLWEVAALYAPDNIAAELNDFLLETTRLLHHMRSFVIELAGSEAASALRDGDLKFREPRRVGGAPGDLFPETDARSTPVANPFLGMSGLAPVADIDALVQANSRPEPIQSGESIYDVAARVLGDANRFIELILLNQLEAPYIVSSTSAKPSGTLAWGEFILVPDFESSAITTPPQNTAVLSYGGTVSEAGTAYELRDRDKTTAWREDQWVGFTVTLTSGVGVDDAVRVVVANTEDVLTLNRAWTLPPAADDSYTITLTQFSLHNVASPETKAFGRDLLVQFSALPSVVGSAPLQADIVYNSRRDLAMVEGMPNFDQMLTLFMNTPLGENLLFPSKGVALPVGRPWSEDVALIYTYFLRQSLMRDRRVQKVERPQLSFESGTLRFQAQVQPINTQQSRPFQAAR